jgi:hypothetical protein
MLHHTRDSICPACEEKKSLAHPLLRKYWDAVKDEFPEAHISWTYRNSDEQLQCYKEGKTELLYPKSAHNTTVDGVPHARAMDLFRINPDGQAEWKKSFFAAVASFLEKGDASVEWAGTWKSAKGKRLGDFDHFQLHKEVLN